MRRTAKTLVRIGLLSIGLVLAGLLGAVLLAPRVVDLAAVRDRLSARLSKHLGAEVHFPSVRLAFFPLPRLAFEQVSVTVPGQFDVKVASLLLRPQWLTLFGGEVRVAKIRIEHPQIRVWAQRSAEPAVTASALPSGVEAVIGAVSALSASTFPNATAVIADGRVEIARDDGPPVIVEHIEAAARSAHDRVTFELRAASETWDKLSVQGEIDAGTASGSARLRVVRLRTAPLGPRIEFGDLRVRPPELDVEVGLTLTGPRTIRAEVRGAAAAVGLLRGGEEMQLHNLQFAGHAETNGTTVDVTIEELRSDDLSGRFSGRVLQTPEAFEVDARGTNIGIEQAEHLAAFTTGPLGPVGAVFKVLRGGTVPEMVFRSRATSATGLAAKDAWEIHGALAEGRVHVPGVELDLERVAGAWTIRGDVLSGEHVSAQLGRIQATNGQFRVGLGGDIRELFVDAPLEADASETTALLRRLIRDESFRRRADRVANVTGALSGRLVVGGTTMSPQVRADVTSFRLSAQVEGVPTPLHVEGGRLRYDPDSLSIEGTRLRAGGSELGNLALRVTNAGMGPSVEATTGPSHIVLGDVYSWPAVSALLPQSPRTPKSLSGLLRAASMRLTLPAANPSGIRLEVRGAVEDFDVEPGKDATWKGLKSPISLSGVDLRYHGKVGTSVKAAFTAPKDCTGAFDVQVGPERVDVRHLRVKDAQSDGTFTLSLTATDADVAFRGRIQKETIEGLFDSGLAFGSVQGNAQFRIPLDTPWTSSFEGTLQATNVPLPAPGGAPLRLQSGQFEGNRGTVRVDTTIAVGSGTVAVKGVLSRAEHALVTDLDVTAGAVHWSEVEALLGPGGTPGQVRPPGTGAPPVKGTLRVAADAFTLGDLTWRSVRGLVTLAPDLVTVTVHAADLCGVNTPGRIKIGPDGLDLAFKPAAEQQPINVLIRCVGIEQETATGQFALTGQLTAQGPAADLERVVEGPFDFTAQSGRIYGMGLSAKLVSAWGIATGSPQSYADIAEAGLPYDRIHVKGEIKGTSLAVQEATLEGPTVKWAAEGSIDLKTKTLDLTFLGSPLKAADAVVGRIPIVGGLMGGSLVTVPVRVTGRFGDVRIIPLSPEEVSKGLLRTMKRTLKLPMRLLNQVVPGR